MTFKRYLLSLPERLARSVVGLGAGAVREVGEVAIPARIKRGQLYQNLVDTTLRFLIEQVGGAEGVYPSGEALSDDFLVRRGAGNVLELVGFVAFRASPVWVLAALADVSGMGRELIPEIASALKAEGLLDEHEDFRSLDQMLDGLEKTSARLASTVNTPPLDVATLREDWRAIREAARSLQPSSLPSGAALTGLWNEVRAESARQGRSVFETSSLLGLSAARQLPDGIRWLSRSARVGATRTGQVVAGALLDHYSQTLREIRETGFVTYAARQIRPYLKAAVRQFSPKRPTLTERLLERRSVGDTPKREP